MKTNNKKKIVVSVLALAMGAGLAGSISGSVAWYQYSTRTSANFVGTSIGTSRNLLIASYKSGVSPTYVEGDWKQHITVNPQSFKPASIYETEDDQHNKTIHFVEHPVYMNPYLPAAQGTGYMAEFSFVFKCMDTNKDGAAQVEKQVFLTSLNVIKKDGTKDITSAVRLAIKGASQTFIVSPTATGQSVTTTSGPLDLNNNTKPDKTGYDVTDLTGNEITYRNAEPVDENDQTGLSYTSVSPTSVIAGSEDPYTFTNKDGRVMTTTVAGAADAQLPSAPVTVQVWIEGWQPLLTGVETNTSTLWDTTWFNQNFELQFQFACEANR